MSQTIRVFRAAVEALDRSLRKVNVRHVNKQVHKEAVRKFVRTYFEQWRPIFARTAGSEEALKRVDGAAQDLVRYAQTRTAVSDYKGKLSEVKQAVDHLELTGLQLNATPTSIIDFNQQHRLILESLKKVCEPAAISYEQGLFDLRQAERKSWRGTCVEFREALRETLDTLAPDDAVTKQPGYKQEPNANGPTMRQKTIFILRSRRSNDPQLKSMSEAIDVVEEKIGKFIRSVYTRSSVAVHIAESRDEAIQVRNYVTLVLAELLEIKE